MRKLIIALASAIAGAFVTALLLDPHARADGAQRGIIVIECTTKNGDVNADDRVDIADAVTILGHLFLGSPAELVPQCSVFPTPCPGLPHTGQRAGYRTAVGAQQEVSCGDASCAGQDAASAAGCSTEGRFVDNQDGTVTDKCTGLMWQKNMADVNADGRLSADDGVPWCVALAYCETRRFASHDDWRLPNLRELHSILDYGRHWPALDPVFDADFDRCWSSTTFVAKGVSAWVVTFSSGYLDSEYKDAAFAVRAVR